MENQFQKTNSEIVQYIIDQELKDPDYCELPPGKGGISQKALCTVEWGLTLFFYSASYNARLTSQGMWFMKRWFQVITINFTHKLPHRPKANHLLCLGKNLRTPYFINYQGTHIELFNDEDAIELILLDGDLDQYVRIHKD